MISGKTSTRTVVGDHASPGAEQPTSVETLTLLPGYRRKVRCQEGGLLASVHRGVATRSGNSVIGKLEQEFTELLADTQPLEFLADGLYTNKSTTQGEFLSVEMPDTRRAG